MVDKTSFKKSLFLIIIVFLVMLTVMFFFGGPDHHSTRSFKAFWNLGHILYYSLLAFVIFALPHRKPIRPIVQFIICISVTLIIGLIVELLQSNFHRNPDAWDLFRNMIGAFVGMFFVLPLRHAIPRRPLRFLQTATLFLVVIQIYPIAVALTDEYEANRKFPILADFETPYEIHRWRGNARHCIENTVAATGKHAMRIDLKKDQYSGVSLHYFNENWTGYQWFQVFVYNPSPENLTITCRIHDRLHTQGTQSYTDMFNQQFNLVQGWNTILIDLNHVKNGSKDRRMDMHHIYGIGLYAVRPANPRTIFIDDVMLK